MSSLRTISVLPRCGEGHAWAEALSLWHDSRGVRRESQDGHRCEEKKPTSDDLQPSWETSPVTFAAIVLMPLWQRFVLLARTYGALGDRK